MFAIFLDELNESLSSGILHFALRCGANEFTVRAIGSAAESNFDQFKSFFVGQRRKELPTSASERKRFEPVSVWKFNADAISSILNLCPRGFHYTEFEWVIYKPAYISTVVRPGIGKTYMSLAHAQWEELYRSGFRFSLIQGDGTVYLKQFDRIDLPENRREKLARKYPGLSNHSGREKRIVDELFNSQYGVMSFPPSYGYPRIRIEAASNERILSWWSDEHDQLLTRQIENEGWKWWPSYTALLRLTDDEAIQQWKISDPKSLLPLARSPA